MQLTEFCSRAQICERWSISYQTLRALCKRPDFPRPVKLLSKKNMYAVAEVQAWFEAQQHDEQKRGA